MKTALNQFDANLKRVRDLGGLAKALDGVVSPALDLSDLLRAQVVLAVSALDHLVHELVRLGAIEVAAGGRSKTPAFLAHKIPLAHVDLALGGSPPAQWLGEAIRELNGWRSFQDPEKIADAIRLVSDARLWDEVGTRLALPAKDVRVRLALIVDRRNKIAHEADLDPASPGFRWPIDPIMVNTSVDFIEAIGKAIHDVL